ncbi:MAG: preprotein translocase subunit SecY [Patescibacteria group bacterium]|jgi:preprotein translocase subunit SecY|nr:preprotein translocase subunit SecY [Patescibacteria group bacterium]
MGYIKRVLGNRELRKKIIFVLFILLIYRLLAHVPIPGPDPAATKSFLDNVFKTNSVLSFLDVFSGGGMSRFSVVMMSLGPYVTASIMIQLLTMVIPKLEALSKEGEQGRKKINQYSRILTVPIALIEGYSMIRLLQSIASKGGQNFLGHLSVYQWVVMLVSITAGTILLMWLGELITEKGIGNGISIIIFAGIISRVPTTVGQTVQKMFVGQFNPQELIKIGIFLALALIVVAFIVFITEAQRKVPISYAKKVRGAKLYGGIDTYLPVKLNMAGVIPIIFAAAFMNIPTIIGFLSTAKTTWIADSAKYIQTTFAPNTNPYAVLLFLLVFGFTFFSTFLYFKPHDVAENIQKQGGFIPGIRPGTQTEKYLTYLINRVTLWGAIFLSFISILPFVVKPFTGDVNLTIGGTGLLIVVGVAIEVKNQIDAQLVIRNYEEF